MKAHKKASMAALALASLLAGCGSGAAMEDAEVVLGDYTGIEVEVSEYEVTEEDVKEYAEAAVYYYNQEAVSDRTVVEDGDAVYVTAFFYDKDGNLLDDGNGNEGYVYIGSGGTYEELEQGLIGANVGDELEIPVTFPDPYEYNEELSGLEAVCKATVGPIKETDEVSLDTLTDEQAALIYEGVEDVGGFYKHIRETLDEQRENSIRAEAYDAICSYLLGACKVDPFPEQELEARLEQYMGQLEDMCSTYYGMTMKEYCESIGMGVDEYKEEVKGSLEETLELELVFTAIADKEGIQYEESEFESYIDEALAAYSYGSKEELFEEYGEDYIKSAFRIEYVVDWLIDNADITYIPEAGEAE